MKKICLVVVGFYIGILSAFSQTPDSTVYKSRKLKIEEVNLVSSYYHQNGNNSAVEGGAGSEKLTDIANMLDIKLTTYDKRNRKHTFTGEIGIDNYTSASSDMIDTKANSSASSGDTRIYHSLGWSIENEKKGTNWGLNASGSTEFDYTSIGFGAHFNKKSADKNRELGIKAQAFLDQVKLILPIELRTNEGSGSSARNSYSGSVYLSQVVNKRLQLMFLLDIVQQQGYLSLPFHRVYFDDGSVSNEKLPDSRLKLPVAVRANYFIGDGIIVRSFYRFYHDNWGLNAHTFDLETAIKLSPFVSVSPFYRLYSQSAVDYFSAKSTHAKTEQYYTSNYDLSKFDSHFFGAGFRFAAPKGVFGVKQWNMVEIRYGHYNRTTGLNSDIISLNLRFK